MAEKHVEAYLKKCVEKEEGLCLKFVSPSRRGVCDRICISKNGFTYYVELKFGDNTLSPQQKLFSADLEKRNITMHVLASKEEINEFMEKIYF